MDPEYLEWEACRDRKFRRWVFALRSILVVLLLCLFVAITWLSASFSYETGGAYAAETALAVIPAYMFFGLGLAIAIAIR